MPIYQIHRPLDRFKGAKSGKHYTCTRGARLEAPAGEFKKLKQDEYTKVGEGSPEASAHAGTSAEDGATPITKS